MRVLVSLLVGFVTGLAFTIIAGVSVMALAIRDNATSFVPGIIAARVTQDNHAIGFQFHFNGIGIALLILACMLLSVVATHVVFRGRRQPDKKCAMLNRLSTGG